VAGAPGDEDLRRALPAEPHTLALGLAGAGSRPRPRTPILTRTTRTRAGKLALVALRVVISASIAAGLTAFISSRLPRSLDLSTDVVGYPIFANFNVDRYLWIYVLWVAFFPLAAFGIDMALSRLTGGQFPGLSSAPSTRPASNDADSAPTTPTVALLRTAFVGLVLGVEVSIAWDREGLVFLLVCVATTVLYAAIALRIAALTERFRGGSLSFSERLATVNVYASPLTVLGLYSVSQATEMHVFATGNHYGYPWFPLWLALPLTAFLLAVAIVGTRRDTARLHSLERQFVLLVPAPVLLFLVLARLPGELGVLDFFHEGEGLAAAELTADGAVPWRDLMFIHGLLHDVVAPGISLELFGNNRWGGAAGASALVFPAYWLGQYFLSVYLFGRNVLFLLGTQLAVVLDLIRDAHIRFALLPFALLLLAAVLRRPTWPRMAALAAVVATQTVVSPETTIFVPACFVVLGLYELSSYDRQLPFHANFHRTLGTAAAGLVILGAFASVLAALHALDDFFFFYRTFAPDHSLTGGIPLEWLDTRFKFAAIAPVVLVILAIWFFAVALRARRSPAVADWVMGALAITVLLYYPKFLARPDFHVYQPFAVAIPLLAYAVYRIVDVLEHRTAQFEIRIRNVSLPTRYWITVAAVLIVAVASPRGIFDAVGDVPGRLSATAHYEPFPPRLGYMNPLAIDLKIFTDLERQLDTYLEPRDHLFDFSNNPMVFHYLLDRRPSTRYFHVSMAIRKHTQADLVRQLERDPPKLVVFSSSPAFGLPWWDSISNQVRHYDVSQYILDHYRPVFESHTFVLMARNDFARGLAFRNTDQLYFANLPCDWGYAPNFLDTRPEPEELRQAVSVPFRPTEGVFTVAGWAVDLAASAPAQEVVAALGSRVVARASPSSDRADIAGQLQDQRYARSGFTVTIPGSARLERLRFFVLTRSGEARELGYGTSLAPTTPVPKTVISAGRSFRVSSGETYGEIESAAAERPTYTLELPAQAGRRFNWLEIRTGSSFVEDTLGVTDVRGEWMRTIAFKTLDRGRRSLWIQVGACSQWHGFRDNRLYLESAADQQISEVRLVP
jgi:hypothetical protein